MPRSGDIIYVFNEHELDNFIGGTGETLFRVPDSVVLFGNVIKALRKLRDFQRGARPRVFVTLGADGAICLDADNLLHFCRVARSQEVQKVLRERNAIGDLFAATLLGLYASGAERKYVPILCEAECVNDCETTLIRN